jgi:hypothetical protein
LLDRNYQPTAAYDRLRHLIKERWSTSKSGNVEDGQVAFRGFYGEYELSVTLASGKTITGKFTVPAVKIAYGEKPPTAPVELRVRVNEAKGAIEAN